MTTENLGKHIGRSKSTAEGIIKRLRKKVPTLLVTPGSPQLVKEWGPITGNLSLTLKRAILVFWPARMFTYCSVN